MAAPHPCADPHIEWSLRYARELQPVRFVAAEIVASYDYLLAPAISMAEATRRLRLLRAGRRAAMKESPHG